MPLERSISSSIPQPSFIIPLRSNIRDDLLPTFRPLLQQAHQTRPRNDDSTLRIGQPHRRLRLAPNFGRREGAPRAFAKISGADVDPVREGRRCRIGSAGGSGCGGTCLRGMQDEGFHVERSSGIRFRFELVKEGFDSIRSFLPVEVRTDVAAVLE